MSIEEQHAATAADAEPDHDQTQETVRGKAKRKRNKQSGTRTTAQFTVRDARWSYLQLKHHKHSLQSSANSSALDEMTARLFMDAALGQFLGLHGRAIPIDVLKLEGDTIWVRIPNEDRPAFTAALSSWLGRNGDALRVLGWSSWHASALGRDAGQALFDS